MVAAHEDTALTTTPPVLLKTKRMPSPIHDTSAVSNEGDVEDADKEEDAEEVNAGG